MHTVVTCFWVFVILKLFRFIPLCHHFYCSCLCNRYRKFAGSIQAGVIGIFYWHNPSGHTEQKWVPEGFPWGKGSRCVRLTNLPPSCAVFMNSENLNFLEPSGPLQACNGTALPFTTIISITYVILFSNLMNYFFIKSIVFLCMFLRWPFGAQVKRGLCTERSSKKSDEIRNQMLYRYN